MQKKVETGVTLCPCPRLFTGFQDAIPKGMKFDAVKSVKEVLSRVEYLYDIKFDPLTWCHIFLGHLHIMCLN